MADDELILVPDRAQRAGVDLAHAGRAVTAERDSLGSRIAAASAERPWGKDEIGAAFDKTYRGYESPILETWRAVGAYLESLGANVVASVNSTVETDSAAGQRIGQTYP
jgi:hypothetical protein